jgi:hypothetical protein
LKRLDKPEKNWRFNARDVAERRHWDAYQAAYEDAIRSTSTAEAPWFVVPADNKWYTRLIVAAAIVDALADLAVDYPPVEPRRRAEVEEARRTLKAEIGAPQPPLANR